MLKDFFKKLFSTSTPEPKTKPKTNRFGNETLENIQFSFDSVTLYEPKLPTVDERLSMAMLAELVTLQPKHQKTKKQNDFFEIIERTAFKYTPDERKQCIAVFEKSNKYPVAYYKISPNSTISMTEFKRKARRHYTDDKKCEYINTRAVSLETYISRLK